MKILIRIIFTSIIVLIVLFTSAYVAIMLKGRAIIIKNLQELTHRQVSIGYFSVIPPLNLEIRNLNIDGLAKVEKIFISASIPYLMTDNIALNRARIIRPEITYEKKASKAPESSAAVPTGISGVATASGKSKEVKPFNLRLIIKHLNIKDGKVNFIDRTRGPEGIKITVKDINFNLANLYIFPMSAIANFELNGRIPWQQGEEEGKIEAEGWINFSKKDIQATLKISDIDGVYLYPYYSNWVDNLEKARIEKANLNFTSNIQGLNNNVTAECHLELVNIVRKSRSPDEPQEKAERIADAVLDIFRVLNQGRIGLDFIIRTKLDRPEFGFGNIKTAVENKIIQARSGSGPSPMDIFMLPAKVLEGTVKGATEFSKAMIDGTFAIGNELKKSVEEAFKKEKK